MTGINVNCHFIILTFEQKTVSFMGFFFLRIRWSYDQVDCSWIKSTMLENTVALISYDLI